MQNDFNNLDELFKKELYKHEGEPSKDTWNNINKAIQAKNASKASLRLKKIYISITGAALVIVASTVYWFKADNEIVEPIASKNKTSKTEYSYDDSVVDVLDISKVKVAAKKITERAGNEQKEIELPDGSKVILNRNTKVSYTDNFMFDRLLSVEGEAYFETKNMPYRPIIISMKHGKIECNESKFYVYSTKEKDEIYVESNTIKVYPTNKNTSKTTVTTGQKGFIAEDYKLKVTSNNDINFDSWKTRKIVFKNSQIKDVITTLEKYFGVAISVEKEEIYTCRFTGTFEQTGLKEILDVLTVTFNLTFDQNEGRYVLKGVGCK